MSPQADQQVAGVIMFGVGNLVYFVAIGVIFLRLFADPESDEAEVGMDVDGAATSPGHDVPAVQIRSMVANSTKNLGG
jgi:hypothetical protein